MSGFYTLCPMRGCPGSAPMDEHICAAHWAQIGEVLDYAAIAFDCSEPLRVMPEGRPPYPIGLIIDALWMALARLRARHAARPAILDLITACLMASRLPDAIDEGWLYWLRLQPRRKMVIGRGQDIVRAYLARAE